MRRPTLASTRRRYAVPEPYALSAIDHSVSPGRTRYVDSVSARRRGGRITSADRRSTRPRLPHTESAAGRRQPDAAAENCTAKAAATARRANGKVNRSVMRRNDRTHIAPRQRPQSRPVRAGGRASRQSRPISTRSGRAAPAPMARPGAASPTDRQVVERGSSAGRAGWPANGSQCEPGEDHEANESDQAQSLTAGAVARVGWGLAASGPSELPVVVDETCGVHPPPPARMPYCTSANALASTGTLSMWTMRRKAVRSVPSNSDVDST